MLSFIYPLLLSAFLVLNNIQIFSMTDDKLPKGALFKTAEEGNISVAKYLLDMGYDINSKDKDGQTALMIASVNGHLHMVKFLVQSFAKINRIDRFGRTALMLAIDARRYEIVKFLLERGADVNVKDKCSRIAIMYAPNIDFVKMLLDAGTRVNHQDELKRTPLMIAAFYGDPQIVSKILEYGVDLYLTNESGQTAFDVATQRGHHVSAKLIKDKMDSLFAFHY